MASDKGGLRYLIDSYLEWAVRQGIPIVEGIAVNNHVEVVAGSLLVIALALATELGLGVAQRLVTPAGVRTGRSGRIAPTVSDA